MITLSEKLIHALGWTLLHALWQIALVALILYLVLSWGKTLQANHRYAWAVGALSMVTVLALTTFSYEYLSEQPATLTVSTAQKPRYDIQKPPAQKMTNRTVHPTAEKRVSIDTLTQAAERHMVTLVMVWMGGVMLLSLRLLGGFVFVQRLKRRPDNVPLDGWQAKVQGLAGRLGLSRPVQVMASAWAQIPMVIGHLKPVILLPAALIANLPPEQLEAVLAHELAHIYRKDYWINLLQSVIEIIFFFHPATWWMAKVICTEREHCCDDLAVRLCGNTLTYAKALVQLEENQHKSVALAMAANGNGGLVQRIERLLSPGSDRTALPVRYVLLTVALAMMVAVCVGMTYKMSDGGFSNMLYSPAGKPSVGRIIFADTAGRLQSEKAMAQETTPQSDTTQPAAKTTPTDRNTKANRKKLSPPDTPPPMDIDTLPVIPGWEISTPDGAFTFHFSRDTTEGLQYYWHKVDTGVFSLYVLPNLDTLWPVPVLPHLDSLLQEQTFWRDTLIQRKIESAVQQIEERTEQLQARIAEQRPRYDSLAAHIAHQQMIHQEALLEAQIKALERQAEKLERQIRAYEKNADQKVEEIERKAKEYEIRAKREAVKGNAKEKMPAAKPLEDREFDQLEQSLFQDKLIEKDKKYHIEVTSNQLLINGKKQSRGATKKYKALLAEVMDIDLDLKKGDRISFTKIPGDTMVEEITIIKN